MKFEYDFDITSDQKDLKNFIIYCFKENDIEGGDGTKLVDSTLDKIVTFSKKVCEEDLTGDIKIGRPEDKETLRFVISKKSNSKANIMFTRSEGRSILDELEALRMYEQDLNDNIVANIANELFKLTEYYVAVRKTKKYKMGYSNLEREFEVTLECMMDAAKKLWGEDKSEL